MARTIPILEEALRREFDRPPRFTYSQRKYFFALPTWAEAMQREMLTPHARIGFILQVGYFRMAHRFFSPKHFLVADIDFVRRRWKLPPPDWERYEGSVLHRHRQAILHQMGVAPFDEQQRQTVLAQALHYARRQMKPSAVFRSTADFIRSHQIELPTYAALAEVVTLAMRGVETQLAKQLQLWLTPSMQQRLDELGEWEDASSPDGDETVNPEQPLKRYRLTGLKRPTEVMKPSVIRDNVVAYRWLKQTYQRLGSLLANVELTDEMIHYYAGFVLRARHHQLFTQAKADEPSMHTRRYVRLICFVVYQYYWLGDLLTETMLSAVQTHRNAVKRDEKERLFQHHQTTESMLTDVLDGVLTHVQWLDTLEDIALSFSQTHEQKVAHLIDWLRSTTTTQFRQLSPKVRRLQQGGRLEPLHYQLLEERSRTLQNRFADILRHVDYQTASGDPLGAALTQFRERDGQLPTSLLTDFLKPAERIALEKAASPVSLYKVLLAQHVADALKSGRLNLPVSFAYRPFEEYLIDEAT